MEGSLIALWVLFVIFACFSFIMMCSLSEDIRKHEKTIDCLRTPTQALFGDRPCAVRCSPSEDIEEQEITIGQIMKEAKQPRTPTHAPAAVRVVRMGKDMFAIKVEKATIVVKGDNLQAFRL